MKRMAVYAGSFDPPTNGHLDIIQRVQPLFDKVFLLVADNPSKKCLFTAAERTKMLQEALEKYLPKGSFEVKSFPGLVVDFCKKVGATVLIRGLRALSDFESEFQMATMNRRLAPEIDTLHMMTDEKYFFISSTLIKEIAYHGAALKDYVPPNVARALKGKNSK